MTVVLEVPDHVDFQLVYRMVRTEPFNDPPRPGVRFAHLTSAGGVLQWFGPLKRCLGSGGAVKAVLKAATPRRSLYLLAEGPEVVSIGWCTTGLCRHYKVEPDAVVIGPIWTADSARGKGYAPAALRAAADAFIRQGRSVFYIDTSKANLAAQRVFNKCEFGPPVALYFR